MFLPLLVLVNIIFSFFTTDLNTFYKLTSFSVYYFGISLLFGLAPWLTHSLKIKIWCNYMNYKIPYLETVRIAIGSDLGAAISPTALGGSPIRAAMLISEGVKPADSIFMSLVATVEDTLYFSITFIGLLIFLNGSDSQLLQILDLKYINLSLFYYLAVIIPISIYIYKAFLSRYNWIQELINWFSTLISDISTAFKKVYRDGKLIFLLSFTLNLIQWLVKYIVIYTLLLGLGVHVSFLDTIILGWFVYFVMLFIPTPGAVLGAEAAFYIIFSSMLSANIIGLVTFGWRFLTFYLQLTLGVIIFLSTGTIRIKNTKLSK